MIVTTFILKFLDCALSTIKNVFLIKERYFLSSVCNSLAAMLFIFVADIMANTDGGEKYLIAIAVFLANFIGSYLPPKFMDKMESDRMFIYNITADSFENGMAYADKLKEFNVTVSTTVAYDSKTNKTLQITAYSQTKQQSTIIVNCMKKKFKYHVIRLD
jgi:uncharacterized protein YebE (UPF0316 family)